MKCDLNVLSQIYDEQIWLEISEADLAAAEPKLSTYSNQTGRYHAFMNRLCLNALLRWMNANLSVEIEPKIKQEFEMIWEFFNGVTIVLEDKKLVFLPSDALDTQDFAIPQEWVDIPNLAADYYVPIQVDLENQFLRVWGFISRQNLKKKAEYDRVYRTYYVEQDHVILNVETLWDACHFCGDEKGAIEPLTTLSNSRVEELIEKLSQPSPYSPRLEIKFEEWGALLNQNATLQKLYQRRLEKVKPTMPIKQAIVDLHHWLAHNFDESMQLGWQAVSNFGTVVPTLSQISIKKIRQAKLLNLQMQMKQEAVILLIAIAPEEDGRCGILVQLHPNKGNDYLPNNLSLTLRSNSQENLQSTVARERDNFIQLRYFRCQPKTQFSIEVTLGETTVTEHFVT